eukprot:1166771-Prymnesium_polylepis.1
MEIASFGRDRMVERLARSSPQRMMQSKIASDFRPEDRQFALKSRDRQFTLKSPCGFLASQHQQPGKLLDGSIVASRYKRLVQYAAGRLKSSRPTVCARFTHQAPPERPAAQPALHGAAAAGRGSPCQAGSHHPPAPD